MLNCKFYHFMQCKLKYKFMLGNLLAASLNLDFWEHTAEPLISAALNFGVFTGCTSRLLVKYIFETRYFCEMNGTQTIRVLQYSTVETRWTTMPKLVTRCRSNYRDGRSRRNPYHK